MLTPNQRSTIINNIIKDLKDMLEIADENSVYNLIEASLENYVYYHTSKEALALGYIKGKKRVFLDNLTDASFKGILKDACLYIIELMIHYNNMEEIDLKPLRKAINYIPSSDDLEKRKKRKDQVLLYINNNLTEQTIVNNFKKFAEEHEYKKSRAFDHF